MAAAPTDLLAEAFADLFDDLLADDAPTGAEVPTATVEVPAAAAEDEAPVAEAAPAEAAPAEAAPDDGPAKNPNESSELLLALYAAAEARAGAPIADQEAGRTAAAMELYCAIASHHDGIEPAAREIMTTLAAQVLADAAVARVLMRDDPSAAGLEATYRTLLSELSTLATVFGSVDPAGASPDPGDEHAELYTAVCAELAAIMRESAAARPAWRFIRLSYAEARRAPPPRRRPRTPLADNQEYYAQ
jgi:hypothetical protein